MSQFLMPSLGADMEAGTLIEWLKKPGEKVARGDIIAVVETQKGAIEIEVFEDGVLGACLVDLGTKVPVGTPLAVIENTGDAIGTAPKHDAPEASAPKPAPAPDKATALSPPPPPVTKPATKVATATGTRRKITPAARRQAARDGIDLASVAPGSDGIIALAELKSLTESARSEHPSPMSDMRAAISAAMSRSKREIPHYYLAHTVDISAAEKFVTRTNKKRTPETRILPGVLYLKAVAKALEKYPELNGHFIDGEFHGSKAAHIGVATNIRSGGLVAPAIHDVQTRDLDALMEGLRDLVARVRAGRFRARELSDATITVTSLGDRGVDLLYGVINPPQVAIVGIGTAVERPWVHKGKIKPRKTVTLTLAADHRVSDGHRGALFLGTVGKYLQTPEEL
jgi:pyruvate dehydrogenase E2 component (dihydrolipoamide acetyltransferase)